LQLTLIRNKYKREQGSLLNSVLSVLKYYAKGGAILLYKLIINVPYGRVAYTGKLPTFAKTTLKHPFYTNASTIGPERRVKRFLD
jgi:hypothetical protein